MQPGFDLRLRTMMKALAEVVLPAIEGSNRMAQEQAKLVLGSLEVIRQQVDHAHWYEAAELVSLCNLAGDLAAVKGFDAGAGLDELRKAGGALVARWDVSLPELREASVRLRDAISEAVERAGAGNRADVSHAVSQLVMVHAEGQIGRERAFIAGTRWDTYPDTLRSIEDSLRKAEPLRRV